MAAPKLEGLIFKQQNLHGGRPVVAGTGVTVRTIFGHYKLGLPAEEITDEMNLSLAGVYAALATYQLNRDEIEADIKANSDAIVKQEIIGD